jgi:hypothetical protein
VLPGLDVVLLAVGYLLLKHAIADFFLQTPYQWKNKGRYGHPGGLLHAAIHVALTAPVFLILPPANRDVGIALLAGEFVLHYHIDWLKERTLRTHGWTTTNSAYWRATGVDQLAHNLTYVAIVWALLHGIRFGL